MSPEGRTTRGPSPWLAALEGRAVAEFGAMQVAGPLLRRLRRGDGHPVLVLPGFTAGDRSTGPLRERLRDLGYFAHGWRLGQNLGPTPKVVDGLIERLDSAFRRDGQKVSLVGWSLGGIYARELAHQFPDKVRQVITLGSPFRMVGPSSSPTSALYQRLSPMHAVERPERLPESERPPLRVPATAIYSKTDGVVRWWQCLESEGRCRENIRVLGSHTGLGFNPAVVYAVSDRLAQPLGEWQPFHAPRWAQAFYPRAVAWRESSHRRET